MLDPDVQRSIIIEAPAVLGLERFTELDERHAFAAIVAALEAAAAAGKLRVEDPVLRLAYDERVSGRDPFAGGDQPYLRDHQYRDPSRLTTRANLHARYGTATIGWFDWVVTQINWPPGAEVLEVGCGPGWLWAAENVANLPAGLRLTLTDLSPGMVEVARARVGSLNRFATLDAREADVQGLPFDDQSFDVVVANHMLYHAPDPGEAVAELGRVLRGSGILAAATIGPRHMRELDEIRTEVFGVPLEKATAKAFGSVTGAAILRRSFGSVEWRDYDDTLLCGDPDDVVAFITSTPPGESASEADLRALRQEVDRRFAAGNGVLSVTKETGLFLARGPIRHPPRRPPAAPQN